MPGFDVETVLVPVDGSDASGVAAEYAVAVAKRYGSGVHVLTVLGGRGAHVGLDDATDDDLADADRAVVEDVRRLGSEAGVEVNASSAYGFSTTRKLHHPGSIVLDAADEVDADFLVIPREPDGTADVLEKVAEYVLSYASQPVLSV